LNGLGPAMHDMPWDHSISPHYPGPVGMPPPHMAGGYPGGLPPHHLMGHSDHSLLASRENDLDPYGAHGGLSSQGYAMAMEALQHGRGHHMSGGMDQDRSMGLYMPPTRNPHPPTGALEKSWDLHGTSFGGPGGIMSWQYGSAPSSQLGQLGGHSMAPGHPPMGTDLRRYPHPRGNGGLDASRQGPPLLDPNLAPWIQGGIPDMPYPVSGAYLDRMNGLPDGRPPLVGVQCGGPTEFEGY
jgi:hypothetical protein